MSLKQFPNRREEHLGYFLHSKKYAISLRKSRASKQESAKLQIPHSEKSAISSKESRAREQESAKLMTTLHDLIIKRDLARQQADRQWEKAKEYKARGWELMALESKQRCENQELRVRCYNKEIQEIEKMIDKLSLMHSVGLQKRENYVRIRMEEPPSDNEEQ